MIYQEYIYNNEDWRSVVLGFNAGQIENIFVRLFAEDAYLHVDSIDDINQWADLFAKRPSLFFSVKSVSREELLVYLL